MDPALAGSARASRIQPRPCRRALSCAMRGFSAGWPRAKFTSQLWIGAANRPLPRGYGHLRFATDTAVPRPAIMGQPGKNLRIKHEMSRFRILAKKLFGIPNRNPRRWRRSNVICRSCERPSGARDGKMVGQATRKSGL